MTAPHLTPTRQRATWIRWCPQRLRMITSHPYLWFVTEPDGYERTFDTRAEADAWIAQFVAEAAIS